MSHCGVGRRGAGRHRSRAAHPSLSDKSIYRQWSRTTQDKSGQTGEIEEVQFITWRPELRAGRRH